MTGVSLGRLVLAAVVVLGAGALEGDRGALIAAVAVVVALLALVLWDQVQVGPERLRPDAAERTATSFPSYDRIFSSVVLSTTSGRQWALGLRPVLQRVLAAEVADRGEPAVRARLGERAWRLVDPATPDGALDGATLDDLRHVLQQLETA